MRQLNLAVHLRLESHFYTTCFKNLAGTIPQCRIFSQ